MEIACQNASNIETQLRSMELLSNLAPGCWTTLVFSILGVANNVILLTIAWRLRWFHEPQYALIIHQASVDMISALMMIFESMYPLISYVTNVPNIITQIRCLSIYVPTQIMETCSQRAALIVAIDRLVIVISPYRWTELGVTYRLMMIIGAWIWAIGEEATWLAFVKEDVCVTCCYSYFSYPSAWWDIMVTAFDTSVSVVIVATYIALPPLTGGIFGRLNCPNLVVALDNMEEKQREMVKRVRQLSILTITSYLCTMFIAFILSDLMPAYSSYVNMDQLALISTFLDTLVALNTILPLYLFAWKEKSFRHQLASMFSCLHSTTIYDVNR